MCLMKLLVLVASLGRRGVPVLWLVLAALLASLV
jgi:hypothetical protein